MDTINDDVTINGTLDVSGLVFCHAPINLLGGGSQDRIKLSAQGAGNGGVLLSINNDMDDYRPFEIRGTTVKLKYKVPDPEDPFGHSTMSHDGLTLDTDGSVKIHHDLKLEGAMKVGYLGYIMVNSDHGLMVNNSADTENLANINDNGVLRLHKYAGTGTRHLAVSSDGTVVVV